jgi:hypothetical protein
VTIEQPRGGKVAPPELEVVDVQLVDIRNAPSLLEPKGQRRIKFAMGNLVMALGIFCVWYMSLALSCNEPWFCDVEVGGSSTIHRPGENCVECPEKGFCAGGELVDCQEPFKKVDCACVHALNATETVPDADSQVKDAVCGAVSHWGLPAILALIWMSYSYWHTSAEEEDNAVAKIYDEVVSVMMREHQGWWNEEDLGSELNAKYDEENFNRIWPQVCNRARMDDRIETVERDGMELWRWTA